MDALRLATDAMGTRFELVLGGPEARRLRPAGEAALEEIADWHDRLSLFDPGSFVSHINAHAGRRPVQLDTDMVELLVECDEVRRASGGAFDISVAPLMRAWGFHGGSRERGRAGIPAAGGENIVIDTTARTVRFADPGVAVDLGGIGKGHALDRAAAVLRECGVDSALLHGGTSTVIAIGTPPGCDGWRVRIAGAPATVMLRDAALSVSAPHGREIECGGKRLGHVLDPRTGRPSEAAALAAVVGPSARRADAWSTALLVLGDRPEAMPADLSSLVVPRGGDQPYRVREPMAAVFRIDSQAATAAEEVLR